MSKPSPPEIVIGTSNNGATGIAKRGDKFIAFTFQRTTEWNSARSAADWMARQGYAPNGTALPVK